MFPSHAKERGNYWCWARIWLSEAVGCRIARDCRIWAIPGGVGGRGARLKEETESKMVVLIYSHPGWVKVNLVLIDSTGAFYAV